MFIYLAKKSLLNRKGSVLLTLLSMSISIFVLLGVEHIRNESRENFANTISGTDLIVGARSSSINLLLYSVFRIGSPTNNIDWHTYQTFDQHPLVKWTIPISLGDSHKGFRVVGTTEAYFEHFRYGRKRNLTFKQGREFNSTFDVVIGAAVAEKLGYQIGEKVVLAHGIAATSFTLHSDSPFTIVGILAPTGTPVDRTLHVSLSGIEAIHDGWVGGAPPLTKKTPSQTKLDVTKTPESITAFFVGLDSRMTTFRVQREINAYRKEPISAVLPGVALTELWQVVGSMENTLRIISGLFFASSLFGLSAMLLTSVRERNHEIALLRTIGASPRFIFLLIQLEAGIVFSYK